MSDKFTKSEVNYSRGMAERHCGSVSISDTNYCKHFISALKHSPDTAGECTLVVGDIFPKMWCNKYSKV